MAESLTNIAILYNQRLEFAKAQPLYERALRIYEKARGPDHADVAHCLTDLAVLHLEQVGCYAGLQMCMTAFVLLVGWLPKCVSCVDCPDPSKLKCMRL